MGTISEGFKKTTCPPFRKKIEVSAWKKIKQKSTAQTASGTLMAVGKHSLTCFLIDVRFCSNLLSFASRSSF